MFSGASSPARAGQSWPTAAGVRYAAFGRLDLLYQRSPKTLIDALCTGVATGLNYVYETERVAENVTYYGYVGEAAKRGRGG